MSASRRAFLKGSATAAAALTLDPLGTVADAAEKPSAPKGIPEKTVRARPVPLGSVRLTGGPLKHAQELTIAYLLALDPDRMLAPYRERAGLPRNAPPLTGWDGGGRNLTGHIAGHHLSAVSLMYQATGDARFKQRADYIVRELKEVQDKNGDGYLGALEGGREAFAAVSRGEIKSGGFDLNGLWSPWYTLHKTFAGLRDAYRHAGSNDALGIEAKYAAWAERVVAPLSDAQMAKMLDTEHGGMNEVLSDLWVDTGDARWLALSKRFEHHAFTAPLKRHVDNLNGKHGNCQIPKLLGSAARYAHEGDAGDLMAASFFFDRVAQHHTYATGGHGLAEYFGAPDRLAARVDGRTCESCNEYNMLKLARRLFSFRPDAAYSDYHERALFNHVLASIDDESGRTSYMVPVGRGVQQEYQDLQRDFTCCVGTGMESHALHGYGVYYESDDAAWVTQFVPSTATLSNGLSIAQDTTFPDGDSATLRMSAAPSREVTLYVRRPSWAGDDFRIAVNGADVPQPTLASLRDVAAGGRLVEEDDHGRPEPSTFVAIRRTWKKGDVVSLQLPKRVRLETTDDPTVAAILWGPLVLASDLGPRREGREARAAADATPAFVAGGRAPGEWVVPNGSRPGDFVAKEVARVPGRETPAGDVTLTPFHRTHRRRYAVYQDVLTPAQFDARGAALAAEHERVRRIEAATLGFVQPGEMQPERDYAYASDPVERPVGRAGGRANRGGAGWFSFEMPVDPAAETALIVTYFADVGVPSAAADFRILVDDTEVGRWTPDRDGVGFRDVRHAIPASVTRGKQKVTVKFEAAPNGKIAPIFGVRTVRESR